ncbi:Enoyl-CoA hydratase/carnithine racemase [Rhizobiales bacterium GAS191]|nr:Enoyl-CoA hydratase/carnithine racemase [Rhizobiales bacterium GAS191]
MTAQARIEAAGPVTRSQAQSVAILTLDRPALRNSLSEAMLGALQEEFERIAADAGIRAVILAANGPAFCAGHDLKEMTAHRADSDRGHAYYQEMFARCSKLMCTILRLPQPVIAAVDGVATAAGCQLVASCDLAVAALGARFSTPGVNIGLFCSTPMVALSRNLGRKRAMEMLLTGEMVGAEEALRHGLVNRVAPSGQSARDAAMQLAGVIASKSPLTVKIGKEAFYKQIEMPLEEAYAYTSRVMVENMLARDAEEGIGAFIEKRKPRWTGE